MEDSNQPDQNHAAVKRSHRTLLRAAWSVSALLLIALGGWQLVSRWQATTGVSHAPDPQSVITQDIPEPAESKPVESEYVVPANQPRRIVLDRINASGLIQKVGITSGNAIATPTNINFAGWYVNSVKPGDPGLSIIDGHVSGKYSDAIFKNLRNLQPQDTFSVEFGDKSTRTFTVLLVKTVAEHEAAAALLAKSAEIDNQLNLITCAGAFNSATQSFADRVIVVAKAQ